MLPALDPVLAWGGGGQIMAPLFPPSADALGRIFGFAASVPLYPRTPFGGMAAAAAVQYPCLRPCRTRGNAAWRGTEQKEGPHPCGRRLGWRGRPPAARSRLPSAGCLPRRAGPELWRRPARNSDLISMPAAAPRAAGNDRRPAPCRPKLPPPQRPAPFGDRGGRCRGGRRRRRSRCSCSARHPRCARPAPRRGPAARRHAAVPPGRHAVAQPRRRAAHADDLV